MLKTIVHSTVHRIPTIARFPKPFVVEIEWIVVTDDDIDIRDPFMREWALGFRVEPAKDISFIRNTSSVLLDPSSAPPEVPLWDRRSSKILIDATKNWEYTDIALPPQKYLDDVARQWEKYGLT